jgi:hypothetical protein
LDPDRERLVELPATVTLTQVGAVPFGFRTRTENRKLVDVVPEAGATVPESILNDPQFLASVDGTNPARDATIQLASTSAPARTKRGARRRSISRSP